MNKENQKNKGTNPWHFPQRDSEFQGEKGKDADGRLTEEIRWSSRGKEEKKKEQQWESFDMLV